MVLIEYHVYLLSVVRCFSGISQVCYFLKYILQLRYYMRFIALMNFVSLFYCQIEGDDSSELEVKVIQSGENNFRVEAGGLQTDVTLAHYLKVCFLFLLMLCSMIMSYIFLIYIKRKILKILEDLKMPSVMYFKGFFCT
jgi:Methylcrotonoyl-CoA carboxylase subunit alpha BT domain